MRIRCEKCNKLKEEIEIIPKQFNILGINLCYDCLGEISYKMMQNKLNYVNGKSHLVKTHYDWRKYDNKK